MLILERLFMPPPLAGMNLEICSSLKEVQIENTEAGAADGDRCLSLKTKALRGYWK